MWGHINLQFQIFTKIFKDVYETAKTGGGGGGEIDAVLENIKEVYVLRGFDLRLITYKWTPKQSTHVNFNPSLSSFLNCIFFIKIQP